MKRTIFIALLALVVFAGSALAGPKEFWKGGIYVTPQIGLNSWGGGLPFGVNAEFGLTENIGIAGTAMFNMWKESSWSETLINLAAEANYHFLKLNAQKIDVYAGAGPGYSIYSWKWNDGYGGFDGGASGGSGIYVQTVVGGRYYFNPKIAASVRLVGSLVGNWAGFGATVGVTFILK
ncbi:MAG: hypothetical protein M0C28_32115 [Candidatus Moduliflexus flocculans]|nr:hypothetical protein [Candidatus Moduliflexus flocculans]